MNKKPAVAPINKSMARNRATKAAPLIKVDNYRYFSGRLFNQDTLNHQAAATLRSILES